MEPDRALVHHLDARDRADRAGEAARAALDVRDAGDGEGDVVGGEGPAVVPGDAGTQPELPDRRLDRRPALGQPRSEARLCITADQRVEYMGGAREVRGRVGEMRVGGIHGIGEADRQRLRRCGQGREREEDCGQSRASTARVMQGVEHRV
jgi:hypothetical protein